MFQPAVNHKHVAGFAVAAILGATGVAAYTTTHHASTDYTSPKSVYNPAVTQTNIASTICTTREQVTNPKEWMP